MENSRALTKNIVPGTIRAPAEKLGMTSGHYDKKFYETNYPDSKQQDECADCSEPCLEPDSRSRVSC